MSPDPFSRRSFLAALAASTSRAAAPLRIPVRPITAGPSYHWFGYYDKLQFDPTSRYVLGMEVAFEHRSPAPDDMIRMGMVDLASDDRWIHLGTSVAWNWQQGSMLQWLPGSKTDVIWNDRQKDRFVSHVLNVRTRKRVTLPAPVYAVSPDARWAVFPDFRRLNDTRPGYGYTGLQDPNAGALAPGNAGIWRMDLRSGKYELLLSFADVAKIPYDVAEAAPEADAKHWFNHLLFSPDGSRFIFLHRWRGKKEGRNFGTRMFTASIEGRDLHVLDPYGKTSHFIWRDPKHVLAWAWHPSRGEKFYLYEDRTAKVEAIGPDVMTVNGHCSYLPGNRWIVNDTYPDADRNQNLYLYDTTTGKRVDVAGFASPRQYSGEWRCDLHPRFSPDGRLLTVDSPHAGNGRQMYLVDISGIG